MNKRIYFVNAQISDFVSVFLYPSGSSKDCISYIKLHIEPWSPTLHNKYKLIKIIVLYVLENIPILCYPWCVSRFLQIKILECYLARKFEFSTHTVLPFNVDILYSVFACFLCNCWQFCWILSSIIVLYLLGSRKLMRILMSHTILTNRFAILVLCKIKYNDSNIFVSTHNIPFGLLIALFSLHTFLFSCGT